MTRQRPLRIGCFDVRGATIAAVDEVIPVVIEACGGSGSVTRVHTWPLSPAHRGRPTASAIALTDTEVLVASPAAGGLVRIHRESGASVVLPLPTGPRRIVVGRAAVWVTADPNHETGPDRSGQARRPPVLWEEPTEEEMERWRARMAGRFADFADDRPPPTAAYWRAMGDSEDVVPTSTPVWKVTGMEASAVDVAGFLADLAIVENCLVAVGEDPGDWRAVGSVAAKDGVLFSQAGRVWLLGYCGEVDDGHSEVREVDIAGERVGDPLPTELQQPVAVVSGHVVDLTWSNHPGWDEVDGDDFERADVRRTRLARLLALDGGPAREVEIAPVVVGEAVASGAVLWLRRPDGATLVAIDIRTATGREVTIDRVGGATRSLPSHGGSRALPLR